MNQLRALRINTYPFVEMHRFSPRARRKQSESRSAGSSNRSSKLETQVEPQVPSAAISQLVPSFQPELLQIATNPRTICTASQRTKFLPHLSADVTSEPTSLSRTAALPSFSLLPEPTRCGGQARAEPQPDFFRPHTGLGCASDLPVALAGTRYVDADGDRLSHPPPTGGCANTATLLAGMCSSFELFIGQGNAGKLRAEPRLREVDLKAIGVEKLGHQRAILRIMMLAALLAAVRGALPIR